MLLTLPFFVQGLNLPKPEVVPFRLTANMVDAFGPVGCDGIYTASLKDAMAKVSEAAQKCFAAYQIPGTANFKMVIANTGNLKSADQSGDFTGTPTGLCLDEAIKLAKFPKSKKEEIKVISKKYSCFSVSF